MCVCVVCVLCVCVVCVCCVCVLCVCCVLCVVLCCKEVYLDCFVCFFVYSRFVYHLVSLQSFQIYFKSTLRNIPEANNYIDDIDEACPVS